MAHLGTLSHYHFAGDVDDVRGTPVYGRDNEKLGKIDDVIFDHESGDILYLVVDSGGWLKTKRFLVPADQVQVRDDGNLFVNLTQDQISRFPEYNEDTHKDQGSWDQYERQFRQAWTEAGGVMYRKGDPAHIITPTPDELAAAANTSTQAQSSAENFVGTDDEDEEIVEEEVVIYAIPESPRWRAFEDHLRRNRVDITASCRNCAPAKDRAA